jgi:threonine synthase
VDDYQYPDVKWAKENMLLVRSALREINSSLDVRLADQPDSCSRLAYYVIDAKATPVAKLTLSAAESLGWATIEGQTSLHREIAEQLEKQI